jgi:methionyl-tRNA synthetase
LSNVSRCPRCNQLLINSTGNLCARCLSVSAKTLDVINKNYNPNDDYYNLETDEIEWLIEQSEKLQKLYKL